MNHYAPTFVLIDLFVVAAGPGAIVRNQKRD